MPSEQSPGFVIYKPPFRPQVQKPSVILYGNIEKGELNWRDKLASSLSDLPVAVLNPHCDDWDETWIEDISFPEFKEQVEWEMDYAQVADVIAFRFGPETEAPISLLELGMYAGTGKVVVCCHPEYKKKGNVQMVCLRYSIPLFSELDGLKEQVREILTARLESRGST
jgi:hypothetical protein